jgi:hypothetical protein
MDCSSLTAGSIAYFARRILPRHSEIPTESQPGARANRQVYAARTASQHFFRLELSILLT